jgi:flavin-dependent dehydrogenase
MINSNSYEVIVVGGGPAGSTAAALLAGNGRRVLLLEKQKMPRYHVGESLMPYCWFTLDRLGLTEQMKEHRFVQKLSVQFVGRDGKGSRPFYFFQHHEHPSSYTWQVERQEFDQMLYENAASRGAILRDQTTVRGLLKEVGDGQRVVGVRAESTEGQVVDYHADLVIDCSGRDCLVASKEGWRQRDPQLNKVAIWTYYRGAVRDAGLAEGSTTVAYIPERGWFWFIPLKGDVVSVGVVAERDYLYRDAATRDPAAIMAREIPENSWVRDHLAPAEQFGEYWVTGEYSYRSSRCAGDGVVLAGDAFGFLDPVFSSGVFLALKSGEMVADAAHAALAQDRAVRAEDFREYGASLESHIETMRAIVYAFYDEGFNFGELIRRYPEVRADLTDCLIGNLSRDFTELFKRVAEFADLPDPISRKEKHPREMAIEE